MKGYVPENNRFTKCKCGNDEFHGNENYCCSNANCIKHLNGNVTCSHGQVLPFTKRCNQECPRNEENYMAISSCDFVGGCPSSDYYSMMCIKSDQVTNNDFGSFCDVGRDFEGISCSKSLNSKWSFDQCYTNASVIR